MNGIELKVNAKINLSLNIVSKLPESFHGLDTVMVSVNIADTIIVSRRRGNEINVRMFDGGGRALRLDNERNSAYKAAYALMQDFKTGGLDINIIKRIPFSAGLGGSSADAAGVIAAVEKLFAFVTESHPAFRVPLKRGIVGTGSDVPYMLQGGFARVTGRGENIESLDIDNTLHLVIAKGKSGCSTKVSYDKFDELGVWRKGNSEKLTEALRQNDIDSAGRLLHNDLQIPSISVCPEIQTTLDLLRATNPVNCIMSGSGSACFGLYRTADAAGKAAESLKGKLAFVQACTTAPKSIEF